MMALSKMLSCEVGVMCTHEGNLHSGVDWSLEQQTQLLPYLTLENYQAYSNPEQAKEIFATKRSEIGNILEEKGLIAFGDVAYNNAPFVQAIPLVYPHAKLIVMMRDGRDFVRSVYTVERPDPTPVGWLDDEVELSPLERYVAFGRLRPTETQMDEAAWNAFDALEKNAWLWAETMRLIVDGRKAWNDQNVLILKFEEFFADTKTQYTQLRAFLGLSNKAMPAEISVFFDTPVNSRKNSAKFLPKWQDWSPEQMGKFDAIAGDMMAKLGYYP